MTTRLPKYDPQALARAIKRSGAEDADLKRADLTAVCLEGVELSQAELVGAKARDAKFITTSALITDWSKADLRGAWFLNVSLRMASFVNAKLDGATFVDCTLEQAYFEGELKGARFVRCDLRDADLSKANLAGASFEGGVLVSKKTKLPKGAKLAESVTTPKAWMTQEGVPLIAWIRALKKNGAIDVDAWLAGRK